MRTECRRDRRARDARDRTESSLPRMHQAADWRPNINAAYSRAERRSGESQRSVGTTCEASL